MALSEREKKWKTAVAALKKKMPGCVWHGEKRSYAPGIESTGLPSIDIALGVGGLPRKRIIELYGPEASGKTTLCLLMIAEIQKKGGNVAYLDAENSLDPKWAGKLGVDFNKLVIVQQEDAPTALDAVLDLIKSGECDLLVVDSVAALVSKNEIEGDMGDQQVGEQARIMSKLMRVITVQLMKTNTMAIFTNQIRMKIGQKFGNPEDTPGGKALKFYASLRLDVRKASDEEAYKAGEHVAKVRVAKNKLAPPFAVGYFRINANGVMRAYSVFEPAVDLGVIKHVKGTKKYEFNGKEWTFESRVIKALEEDPALCEQVIQAIHAKFAEDVPAVVEDNEEPPEMDPNAPEELD